MGFKVTILRWAWVRGLAYKWPDSSLFSVRKRITEKRTYGVRSEDQPGGQRDYNGNV
jgi:hypothetical protein